MAIEAPLSRYKKNNMIIITMVLIVAGVWFYKDGYTNADFIAKHTNEDQSMDHTLLAHRYGWPVLVAGGLLTGAMFLLKRDKKIVADEKQLTVGRTVIPFDSIDKINKTNFDKKGYFTITYKDNGTSRDLTLSERTYDNLSAILDHTVSKIS